MLFKQETSYFKRQTINLTITISFGIVILSSLATTVFPLHPVSTQMISTMPSSSPTSLSDSTQNANNDCSSISEQTVVRWLDMYWYPCEKSWLGICIWPPFHRRHITYKITVNRGTPDRDENGNPIVIAKGKIRDWTVFDSDAWAQIAEVPLQLARYPDYKPIADNEYVVLVETRYRLFNNVKSTVRICVEP